MLRVLILAALIWPLTACHDRTPTAPAPLPQQPTPKVQPTPAAPPAMPGDPISSGLNKASLSQLFQASLEERHQLPEEAGQHYLAQARQHGNRTLALYAWRSAKVAHNDTLAKDAITLWTTLYEQAEKNHTPITPDDLTMMHMLCEQALQSQHWSDALFWQLSLDRHGDHDAIDSMLETWMATEQPMPREALRAQVDAYLRQHPDHDELLIVCAALLAGEGSANGAIHQLNTILQRHPYNLDALFTKAFIEQRLGRNAAALKTVQMALAHSDHQEYRFALLRIDLELDMRHTNAADGHINQFVHQLPASAFAINELAQFLIDHHHAEATQHLLSSHPLTEEEAQNDALQANRQALQGITADQLDNISLALHAFRQVTPASSLFAHAQLRLLTLTQEHEGHDAAARLMRGQRERFPDQALLLVQLELSALQQAHQFDKANELLEQVVDDHPEHDGLRYLRAMQRMTRQQIPEALDDLSLLVQHQPNNPIFLNAYGYALTDQKQDYANALPILQKAAALAPDNAEIQDSLGWTLHGLGRDSEGKQWLARAYDQLPSFEVTEHYLQVLIATHDEALAQQVLDHLYQSTPLDQATRTVLRHRFPMLRHPAS